MTKRGIMAVAAANKPGPTQAQIEAAARAIMKTTYPSAEAQAKAALTAAAEVSPLRDQVAGIGRSDYPAAAEAGGQQTAGKDATVRRLMDEIERLKELCEVRAEIMDEHEKEIAATIERCAQVARNELEECQRCGDCEDDITIGQTGAASRILAGIEALKDKP